MNAGDAGVVIRSEQLTDHAAIAALDSEDLPPFRIPPIAEARVHQDTPTLTLEVQETGHEGDSIAVVRRRHALPERPRHDAKHRAAIESETRVHDGARTIRSEVSLAQGHAGLRELDVRHL